MCNLYNVSPKSDFSSYLARQAARWMVPDYDMRTVGPNQDGVFFRAAGTEVVGQVGQWGMIRPGQPERLDC
jgi:hypothetical protein